MLEILFLIAAVKVYEIITSGRNHAAPIAATAPTDTAAADNKIVGVDDHEAADRRFNLELGEINGANIKDRRVSEMKQLPTSMYGFYYYCQFNGKSPRLLKFSAFAVVVFTFLLQGALLGYLWYSLPHESDFGNNNKSGFCKTDPTFQFCLVFTFFLYLHRQAEDLFIIEGSILFVENMYLWLRERRGEPPSRHDMVKFSAADILVWIMEFLIALELIVVGVTYILVQENASNLIQAILSVVFVSEIDNAGFSWIISRKYQIEMQRSYFGTTDEADGNEPANIGDDDHAHHDALQLIKIIVVTIVMVIVIVCVIFGLKNTYC